jgi:hypothetical protein
MLSLQPSSAHLLAQYLTQSNQMCSLETLRLKTHALMFGTPIMPASDEMLTTRGLKSREADWASMGKKACSFD